MSRGTFCPTTPELPATHTCKLRLHIAIFVSRFTFEPAWNAHWCIYTRSALVRLHEKRIGASTREARWCVYTRSALVRLHEKRVGASTREARWCVYTRSSIVLGFPMETSLGTGLNSTCTRSYSYYIYT